MKEYLVIVVAFFLVTSSRYSNASLKEKIDSHGSLEGKEVTRAALNLIEACLLKDEYLVAVAAIENVEEEILKNLSKITTVAFVNYSNRERSESIVRIMDGYPSYGFGKDHQIRWGASVFLVLADSASSLKTILTYSKTLTWWNASATFVAMEENPKNRQCRKAYHFLWTMWKTNLLSSYFFCLDDFETTTLYTYNPYNDFAPSPWKKATIYKGRKGHPWIMLERKYTPETSSCESIDFDKTQNLEGYPIRINGCANAPFVYVLKDQSKAEEFLGVDGIVLSNIFATWNVTVINSISSESECDIGDITENGTSQGTLVDIVTGKADININARYMRPFDKFSMAYPHSIREICFASRIREKRILLKPKLLLSIEVHGTFCLLFLLSVVTLRFLEGRTLSSALLDSLKMMLYNGLDHSPRTIPGRLITFAEFLALLVFHCAFVGQFIAILMESYSYLKLDTVKDLENTELDIYGQPSAMRRIDISDLRKKYVSSNDLNSCLMNLRKPTWQHVCVRPCLRLKLEYLTNRQIHISKERLNVFHILYVTVMDWPLLKKFDRQLQWMVQAGLPTYWKDSTWVLIKEYGFNETLWKTKAVKALPLKSLLFSFQILILGLLLAFVVFICELATTVLRPYWARIKSLINN